MRVNNCNEHDWLWHIEHLSTGVGYWNGCNVCELTGAGASLQTRELLKDIEWYQRAQKSGKRNVRL